MDDYAALVDRKTMKHKIFDTKTTGHDYLKPYWTTEGLNNTCWISLSESDSVAVLDFGKKKELAYLPVGDHPQRVRHGYVREEVLAAGAASAKASVGQGGPRGGRVAESAGQPAGTDGDGSSHQRRSERPGWGARALAAGRGARPPDAGFAGAPDAAARGRRTHQAPVAAARGVRGVVYGPLAAFWSELFDTRYRYTALSSLYQISGIVASGLTPLIAAWLVSRGDGSLWLVSTYGVAVAAISLVSARLLPETAGRDLDQAWKKAPEPSGEAGDRAEASQTGRRSEAGDARLGTPRRPHPHA